MAYGSWLMAHGQGGPVRPWCPRERRGRTLADLSLLRQEAGTDKTEGFESHFWYIEIPNMLEMLIWEVWYYQSGPKSVSINPYGILEPPKPLRNCQSLDWAQQTKKIECLKNKWEFLKSRHGCSAHVNCY